MKTKRAIGGLLAVGLALSSTGIFAAGDLSYTTQYRDHRVRGATPGELWRYMNAHPIMDPDDGPAYANITHDHDVVINVATSGGRCQVTDLRFRWRFVITLPKPVDSGRMSGTTRSLWRSFLAKLKQHEEAHRAIFLDCGAAFVPAAASLTGRAGCFGMKRKVRQFINKRYDACMATQRAFDKRDRSRVLNHPFIRAATGR